jgi:hypothetical protein
MRRQQLLVRGCLELIAINWTVSLHTLPDPSDMIQFGRGHCELELLPIQTEMEMGCPQQRGARQQNDPKKFLDVLTNLHTFYTYFCMGKEMKRLTLS